MERRIPLRAHVVLGAKSYNAEPPTGPSLPSPDDLGRAALFGVFLNLGWTCLVRLRKAFAQLKETQLSEHLFCIFHFWPFGLQLCGRSA